MSRTFVMGRCLGRGGFGEVYAATMVPREGPRVPVAVKLLHEELVDNDQAVQRMKDEARLLRRLHHPHILQVIALTRLAGRVALVTEFIDGADLSTCIKERDVPPRVALEVVAAVAEALHAAWTTVPDDRGPLRLVHRDVKPSNIRIGREGLVKLLDFGIARSDEITRAAITASDMVVGSPPYLAPERFRKGPPHPQSDVFALGATAFEALALERLVNLALSVQAAHSVDRELWEAFVARRLAGVQVLVQRPELGRFVASLLAHDSEERPDAAACAVQARDLAETLPGPDLASWTSTRIWNQPRLVSGYLAGQELQEGQLQFRTTEVRSASATSARNSLMRSPSRASMASTIPAGADAGLASPVPPASRPRARRRWLALAMASGLGGLGLVAVTTVSFAMWMSSVRRPLLTSEPREEIASLRDPAPDDAERSTPSSNVGAAVEAEAISISISNSPGPEVSPLPTGSPQRPAPRTIPTIAPPATARVRTDHEAGDQTIWLARADGQGGRIDLRSRFIEVEPGVYHVLTVFGESGALRAIPNTSLQAGFTYTIHCDWGMERCSLR